MEQDGAVTVSRQQTARLQLLSKVTNVIVPGCCVENYLQIFNDFYYFSYLLKNNMSLFGWL